MRANEPIKMPRKQTLSMNEIFESLRRWVKNRHARRRASDAIMITFLYVHHCPTKRSKKLIIFFTPPPRYDFNPLPGVLFWGRVGKIC